MGNNDEMYSIKMVSKEQNPSRAPAVTSSPSEARKIGEMQMKNERNIEKTFSDAEDAGNGLKYTIESSYDANHHDKLKKKPILAVHW